MASVIVVLTLLVVLSAIARAATTPSNIRQLFLAACSDVGQKSDVCDNGWTAFEQAFAGKNWNTSTYTDYDPYFRIFPLPTNVKNRVLLWTGTDLLQTTLTNRADLISSANLVSIMIINTMGAKYNVTAWCGRADGGIDFNSTNCPPYTPGTPAYTFYATFSDRLANSSAGVVFFLTENTFRNTSVFALIELPRLLNNTAVTKVVALNVYKYPNGTCNQTTSPLLNIKAKMIAGGKAFDCVDVYGDASQQPPSEALLAGLVRAIQDETSKGFSASGTPVLCVFVFLTTLIF